TPFPGYTALLPILGSVAVMWAGAPGVLGAPTPILRLRPVQFLGNVSYSIYLWHWPLIVIAPFVLEREELDTPTKCALLALTIVVAWVSKIAIEDPVRKGSFLSRRKARYTFALAIMGTAVVFAIVAGGVAKLDRDVKKAEKHDRQLIAAHPTCFGAAARDSEQPCSNAKLTLSVVPTPSIAARTRNAPCSRVTPQVVVPACTFGPSKSKATKRFAIMGDSHAQAWRAAVTVFAEQKGWQGVSVTHTGCGFSLVVKKIPEPFRTQCVDWTKKVPKWFVANPDVDTVFVSGFSGGTVDVSSGKSPYKAAVAGFINAWKTLPPTVKHIIVLRDNPLVRRHGETAACVDKAIRRKRNAGVACEVPIRDALLGDPAASAAEQIKAAGRAKTINLTRFMCDTKDCFPVVGGALVYKDLHHLTRVFATTLGPYIVRAFDRLPGVQ
ncbi:MAG: hypothetical protein QOJ89_2556, partial [bacterium]